MTRCPYGDCTFEGSDAEVEDHVAYMTSFDDPDHAPCQLRDVR